MLLYDLLKTANVKEIINLPNFTRFDEPDGTKELSDEEAEQVYVDFIDRLLALTPVENKDKILLAYKTRDDFEDENIINTTVSLFKISEIAEKRKQLPDFINIPDPYEITEEELEKTWNTTWKDRQYITSFAYEFTPWEEVLGYRVDPDNVEKFGKAEFLNEVLFEMSFNGFQEESQTERREELEKRAEEVEEAMRLPEEERKGKFISLEEVYEHMKEEFGFEYIPPTEEEKRQMHLEMMRTSLWTRKEEAKELKAFLEKEGEL